MASLPKPYRITRADPEDVAALIAVNLASDRLFAGTGLVPDDALEDHVPADVLRQAIDQRHVFVVRDDRERPVGFSLTSLRGGTLYLDQLSVHPDHGRKGLGAALVRRVLSDARDRRVSTVTLSTFREPAWNGPFYRRLGFREIPRKRLTTWMLELEEAQRATLDVEKRCFMRRRVRWRPTSSHAVNVEA